MALSDAPSASSTNQIKPKTISVNQSLKPNTDFQFRISLLRSLKGNPTFFLKLDKRVLTSFFENKSFLDTDGRWGSLPGHLLLRAAQAAADDVGLQLGPPTELHRVVVPGQPGLALPVHHQHEPDHCLHARRCAAK